MLLGTNYPWKFSGDYPPNPPECSSPKWNPGYATAFRAVRTHHKAVFQVGIGTYTPSVHLKILLFLFTNHWNSWAVLQSLELILNYLVNLFSLLLLLRTSASTAFFSIKAYTSKLYDKYRLIDATPTNSFTKSWTNKKQFSYTCKATFS